MSLHHAMQIAVTQDRRLAVLFGAATLLLVVPTFAGVNSWTQIGPEGGSLCSLAFAPSNQAILYVGGEQTSAGSALFTSADNGLTWRPVSTEMKNRSCAVVVDSGDPLRLYGWFEGGLRRSFDGGRSWSPVEPGIPDLSAFTDNVVVAASDPAVVLIPAGTKIFRSHTRGDSWETIWNGEPPITGDVDWIAIDPANAARVAALTSSGGPYLSEDYGDSWASLRAGLPTTNISFFNVVFDPSDSQRLYMNTSRGIYRQSGPAASWQLVLPKPADGYGLRGPQATADGTVFVLDEPYSGPRLLRSRDAGLHWEALPDPFPGAVYRYIRSFVVTPRAIFASSFAGLVRSLDAGGSWQAADRGIQARPVGALAVDPAGSGEIFGLGIDGLASQGLLSTADRGVSWEFSQVQGANTFAIDRMDPNRIVAAGTFAVPSGYLAGISISEDSGQTWEVAAGPAQCLRPETIAVSPRDPNRIFLAGVPYFACESGCSAYRSPDSGGTWSCIQPEDPFERFTQFAPHPGVSGLLLALGREGIYRSIDDGTTWTLVAANPEVPGQSERFPPRFLDLDWANDEIVYVASEGAGLYWSHDRGATWSPRVPYLGDAVARPWLTRLAVDRFHDERIFALARLDAGEPAVEVVLSTDGGLSWRTPSEGLLGWALADLVLDPVTPNRIYVSAEGGGVLAYDIQQPEPCVPSATALCITDGRFKIESLWRDFAGHSGVGHAVQLASDTGSFWFFDPDNLELFVKEIDGVSFNNSFWTFYGALSNVEFTLLATDTATGAQHGYFNRSAQFASQGDIESFPQEESLALPTSAPAPSGTRLRPRAAPLRSVNACVPSATTLCLADGRFAASVTWHDFAGRSGVGTPIVLTPDTGSFWFFDAGIHELAVKVIDGRGTNDAWWVFYGSLSNVEFELTVVDTETGDTWTRSNPSGTFASGGDIEAFPQLP